MMKTRNAKSVACLAMSVFSVSLLVAGCGSNNPFIKSTEDPLKSDGRVTTSGVNQLFDENSFERVNLPDLLDPENRAGRIDAADSSTAGLYLEQAFEAFYRYPKPLQRRNRVQDRLLAASEQRCNLYKNYLKRVETYQSTSFGMLTTILGGAGAIATGTVNSRAFAGLAGISSGIGAELKEGFFANVASQVITPGIELRREEIMNDILAKRSRAITDYTVEAALRDVAVYHGACSLIVGLEAAGIAVKTVENPGLARINATLVQLRQSNTLMKDVREPIDLGEYQKQVLAVQTAARAGLGAGQASSAADTPLSLLAALTENLDAEFSGLAGKIRAQKSDNDALTADPKADAEKKTAATAANTLFTALLNPADGNSLEKRRQGALKVFNAQQGVFGKSNGELADLATALESAKDDDKVKIQGDINTKQNEFRSKKMLPAQTYADKLLTQVALANSAVKANDAAKLGTVLGDIDKIVAAGIAIIP